MPVGPLAADVGFHLGRAGPVGPGYVSFLFGFGLNLCLLRGTFLPGPPEHDAAPGDDVVDIVASEIRHACRCVKG